MNEIGSQSLEELYLKIEKKIKLFFCFIITETRTDIRKRVENLVGNIVSQNERN